MELETLDPRTLDIPSLIRGRYVALVGRPASMSWQEFTELVEANGGRYTPWVRRGVALVVVGQRDWPLTSRGMLPDNLRIARRLIRDEHANIRIVSEEVFVTELGLDAHRQNVQRLYTLSTLTELIGVTRDTIRGWVMAGLLRPAKVEYGVMYFDFRQASTAATLSDLVRSGVTVRRLKVVLEQLRRWLPDATEPLEQLAVIEDKRQLLVRMEEGELAEPDGQLQLDFAKVDDGDTIKLMPGPRTARDWFDQAVEQEARGFLAEAADSYRQALRIGGPDGFAIFNLANVLRAMGKKEQALERYFQAVEVDPKYAPAWNNLGLLLGELARPEDSCSAFRKAISVDPIASAPRYNLAMTLDELGRDSDARVQWREYLKLEQTSQWAMYARRRLSS